jgi:hypothetical protein
LITLLSLMYQSGAKSALRFTTTREFRATARSLTVGFERRAPVADAILDRLVHNAHRLTLNGGSIGKAAAKRSGG